MKFSNSKAQKSIFGDYPTDYAEFEDNGFLEFNGDARAWIDFNFGVGALTRGGSAPDLINVSGTSIQTLGFNGVNTLEQVSAVLEMNHNWAEGTLLRPHVHWLPTTANAGNVVWQLEYAIVQDGDTVPASTTITVTQAASGVAWQQQFATFPTIDATGFTIGAQAFFRLFRDPTIGADTYGFDAAIATFGIHVLLDTLGSRGIGTK